MPRRLRDKTAGTFHVYTHAVWAAADLFRDDVDRTVFLRELARATAKVEWRCVAFCLMSTHYHLLLDVDAGAMPEGMHALNFRFAIHFNMRHRMKGHVFGARYDSRRIRDENDLLEAYKYVVSNPVEARICPTASAWPWSSYAGTVGLREPDSFVDASAVLECFGSGNGRAVDELQRFIEDM
jgi:REP element-mobilizing transposase RayT